MISMDYIDIDISTKTWLVILGVETNDVKDPWHRHFQGYLKVLLELINYFSLGIVNGINGPEIYNLNM
jgi:hypothetical protein